MFRLSFHFELQISEDSYGRNLNSIESVMKYFLKYVVAGTVVFKCIIEKENNVKQPGERERDQGQLTGSLVPRSAIGWFCYCRQERKIRLQLG